MWDFIVSHVSETRNVTDTSSKYAKERTPIEIITGNIPDISEYLDFSLYDYVTYRRKTGLEEPELGKWLGVSHHVGLEISYWILPESCTPISCTTVQRLTTLEQQEKN